MIITLVISKNIISIILNAVIKRRKYKTNIYTLVGVDGIEPSISPSRTARFTAKPHPDIIFEGNDARLP